jgi:hypothetical protein
MVLPINFDVFKRVAVSLKRIGPAKARALLRERMWTSAIGHESTANLISDVLGISVPVNRSTILMQPGDVGIHFFLKQRLPEGTILGEADLKKIQYWFIMSEVSLDDSPPESLR